MTTESERSLAGLVQHDLVRELDALGFRTDADPPWLVGAEGLVPPPVAVPNALRMSLEACRAVREGLCSASPFDKDHVVTLKGTTALIDVSFVGGSSLAQGENPFVRTSTRKRSKPTTTSKGINTIPPSRRQRKIDPVMKPGAPSP